jgi:hypothetical protein
MFYASQFFFISLRVKNVIPTGFSPEVMIFDAFGVVVLSLLRSTFITFKLLPKNSIQNKTRYWENNPCVLYNDPDRCNVSLTLYIFLWWNCVGTPDEFRLLQPARCVAVTLPPYSPSDISIKTVIHGYL